jgi:hypothetical protein
MENRHVASIEPSPDYTKSLIRLRETLKLCGKIYLNPIRIPTLESVAQQNQATEDINQWCTVMEGFIREGGKPARTKDLFRYYLSLLGLNVDKSFVETIVDGDVVEILRTDATRMFFTPELFDYSSYTPEEMFTIPCPQLYRRDEAISQQLYLHGYRMVTGETKEPFRPELPPHVVTETLSERKYSSEIDLKLLAPVRLGHGVVAVAALEKFRLLLS